MRRTARLVFALITVLAASVGVAWAASPGGSSTGTSTTARHPFHRVLWLGAGPLQECGLSDCVGGNSSGVPFTVPGHGSYTAAITVSFQYRVAGTGRFGTGLSLGRHTPTTPAERVLAPTDGPSSTTIVFRARLVGGRQYSVVPTVFAKNSSQQYHIGMSRVLFEINAYPVKSGAKSPTTAVVRHTVTHAAG